MVKRKDVVEILNKYVRERYVGIGSKSCAHFVSMGLKEIGAVIPIETVTVDLMKWAEEVKKPLKIGDLIFFDKTYDALPPGGIGKEDTYTHVGLYLGDDLMYHYSSSLGKPIFANVGRGSYWEAMISKEAPYWRIKSTYLGFEDDLVENDDYEKHTAKIFYHDGKMGIVLDDGTKFDVLSINRNEIEYRRSK